MFLTREAKERIWSSFKGRWCWGCFSNRKAPDHWLCMRCQAAVPRWKTFIVRVLCDLHLRAARRFLLRQV